MSTKLRQPKVAPAPRPRQHGSPQPHMTPIQRQVKTVPIIGMGLRLAS